MDRKGWEERNKQEGRQAESWRCKKPRCGTSQIIVTSPLAILGKPKLVDQSALNRKDNQGQQEGANGPAAALTSFWQEIGTKSNLDVSVSTPNFQTHLLPTPTPFVACRNDVDLELGRDWTGYDLQHYRSLTPNISSFIPTPRLCFSTPSVLWSSSHCHSTHASQKLTVNHQRPACCVL